MNYTVYGSNGASATFSTVSAAYAWAQTQFRQDGGEYECRDDNFDHVFTVEA